MSLECYRNIQIPGQRSKKRAKNKGTRVPVTPSHAGLFSSEGALLKGSVAFLTFLRSFLFSWRRSPDSGSVNMAAAGPAGMRDAGRGRVCGRKISGKATPRVSVLPWRPVRSLLR